MPSRPPLTMQIVRRAAPVAVALALVLLLGADAGAAVTPSSGLVGLDAPGVRWTGSARGAVPSEPLCEDGVDCDSFILTLLPGDYTDHVIAVDLEASESADYDVYVHADTPEGALIWASSRNGSVESIAFSPDPSFVSAPRVYVVRALAWNVPAGGSFTATASVRAAVPREGAPVVRRMGGAMTFSANTTVSGPAIDRSGEPSIRVDVRGNCYVGGIRGVPAGVDLWRFDLDPTSPGFDPELRSPFYLGQPDAFVQQDPADSSAGGADGGGDIEISVSFPDNDIDIPVVTITSLALANISSAVSFDRGETFTLSPATAITPADDREWNESTGPSTVYLLYRAPLPSTALHVQRSDDNGFTYPQASVVSLGGTTPGYIDVDHANGNVYLNHQSSGAGFVSTSTNGGVSWRTSAVAGGGHGQLFDVVKVGEDGTVYSVWATGSGAWDIFLAYSKDEGLTWSPPIQVNDDSIYRTNVMPWIEAGSKDRVAVVWYGTPWPGNVDQADWEVLLAYSTNATEPNPVFQQQVVSDHKIHAGNISLFGLTGAANRNLLDYFQVAIDPQGALVVAYDDDHNDFRGHPYVTRQLDGPSMFGGNLSPFVPTPLPTPDPAEPEVSDFLHDALIGRLPQGPDDSPYDVLWIDYSCQEHDPSGVPMVVAQMKVSDMTPAPPEGGHWRAQFAANAPDGLADRGDQFYLAMDATNPTNPAFTWGTVARGSDGGFPRTERGIADLGVIDPDEDTITMGVRIDQLDPFLSAPIEPGHRFEGTKGEVRGDPATLVVAWDPTRGGRGFVQTCGLVSTPDVAPIGPTATFLEGPMPNPTPRETSIRFRVERAGFVELFVADVAGRRIRAIHGAVMEAGAHTLSWDGRMDRGQRLAPPGIYFFVLHTSSGVTTRKVTLVP